MVKQFKNFLIGLMSVLMCLQVVTLINSDHSEAYSLAGWKLPYNMSYKTTSSYTNINAAWSSAASTWNSRQSYRSLYYAPGSTNYLRDEYTTSASRFGVMYTTYNSSKQVTKFNGSLNRAMSAIRDNSNVRKSTAVHELGHTLGLNHTSNYAIMNTNRNRYSLTNPTTDDLNGIRAIYR